MFSQKWYMMFFTDGDDFAVGIGRGYDDPRKPPIIYDPNNILKGNPDIRGNIGPVPPNKLIEEIFKQFK